MRAQLSHLVGDPRPHSWYSQTSFMVIPSLSMAKHTHSPVKRLKTVYLHHHRVLLGNPFTANVQEGVHTCHPRGLRHLTGGPQVGLSQSLGSVVPFFEACVKHGRSTGHLQGRVSGPTGCLLWSACNGSTQGDSLSHRKS